MSVKSGSSKQKTTHCMKTIRLLQTKMDSICRTTEEQNLVAYIDNGKLYFCTSREILPDQELLFYFSRDYSRQLGGTYSSMYLPGRYRISEYDMFIAAMSVSLQVYPECQRARYVIVGKSVPLSQSLNLTCVAMPRATAPPRTTPLTLHTANPSRRRR